MKPSRRTRLRALGTGKQAQKNATNPSAGAILTCRQDRYLAAEMNRDESARFERHLAACRDCVAFLQTYKTTLALTPFSRAKLSRFRLYRQSLGRSAKRRSTVDGYGIDFFPPGI